MIAYHTQIEKLVAENPSKHDWKKELKFFQTKLLHLQIERIIHLLVTLTVGIATLISCFVTMTFPLVPLFILDGILMVLFFAYILHYRKLENTAQSWYSLHDLLQRKISG